MPTFDLRYFRVAKYTYDKSKDEISYGAAESMGDAMTADLQLKFAEGRCYAEGSLAEYLKIVTGGTISQGQKYIPESALKLLFKAYELSRTVKSSSVKSIAYGKASTGQYVGSGFYAPDMIDGVEKFTAVFVHKVMFGPPGYSYKTLDQNIAFNTPTTTGEFLVDDKGHLLEFATCETEADAAAWIDACFTAQPTAVSS